MTKKIIIAIIVIGAILYFLAKMGYISIPSNQNTGDNSNQMQGISNDNDLMSASKDLDNTDLNSMDSEIKQNDTDASTF